MTDHPAVVMSPDDEKKRDILTRVVALIARFRKTMRNVRQIYKDATSKASTNTTINNLTKDISFKLDCLIGMLETIWADETKKMPTLSQQADQSDDASTLYTSTDTYRLCNIFTWGVWHLLANVQKEATPEFKEHVGLLMDTHGSKAWPIEILFESMFRSKWVSYNVNAEHRASYTYTSSAPSQMSPEYTFSGLQLPTEWNKAGLFYQSGLPFGAILDDIRGRMTTETPLLSSIQGTEFISSIVYCFYEIVCTILEYYDAINEYHVLMKTGKKESRHGVLNTVCFKDWNRTYTWADVFKAAREQAENRANAFLKRGGTDIGQDMFGAFNPADMSQDQLKDIISRVSGLGGFDPSKLLGEGGLSNILGNLTGAFGSPKATA